MNIIQKVVDASLLLLAVLFVASIALGMTPKPPAVPTPEPLSLSAFNYTPGAYLLACDPGKGPKWDDLQMMVTNLR